MSKVQLLLDVIRDLNSLADSIQAVADAMSENEYPIDESQHPAITETSDKSTVKLEQVRAVLAEKSHDGFTAEIRALLQKHGADKLSLIDPSEYESLMKDAEALGNG